MTYPIGTPNTPWTATDRTAWLARQRRSRSYDTQVLPRIQALGERFERHRYGTLAYDAAYPLFGLRSKSWDPRLPTVLITGGVHGYETSGVMGALHFAEHAAQAFVGRTNLAIAPCVSPWGFEHIQRWNPAAADPNRSFTSGSAAQEAQLLMAWVRSLGPIRMHMDLHETTDTDNSEFRPAKAARDGTVQTHWNIPDGFYLVDRSDGPTPEFQKAICAAVASVTHIAEPDENGRLIGVPLQQHGVVEYDAVSLGLCMGMTNAPFCTTTEVYPDSPRTDPETCVLAQVAAVNGGLEFVLE
jgi:hypothetical protein